MKECDICGKNATWKCYGGEEKRHPGAWTDAAPYPENHVFRCDEHKYVQAFFGKPWQLIPNNKIYSHFFE